MNKETQRFLHPDDVLYESGGVLVVNKPGGLLTQAPSGIDSLEVRVRRYLQPSLNRPQSDVNRKVYVGVPHRLDRPASGALVFATNKPTARKLARQFELRKVQKTYWALVPCQDIPESGTWRDFMRKIPDRAQSEIVAEGDESAQFAVLHYRTLAAGNALQLLEIELETGRTHQIRLQAASRGFPIVGDQLYGSEVDFGPNCSDQRERWIGLHARRLRFTHPTLDESIDQVAPISSWWREFPEAEGVG